LPNWKKGTKNESSLRTGNNIFWVANTGNDMRKFCIQIILVLVVVPLLVVAQIEETENSAFVSLHGNAVQNGWFLFEPSVHLAEDEPISVLGDYSVVVRSEVEVQILPGTEIGECTLFIGEVGSWGSPLYHALTLERSGLCYQSTGDQFNVKYIERYNASETLDNLLVYDHNHTDVTNSVTFSSRTGGIELGANFISINTAQLTDGRYVVNVTNSMEQTYNVCFIVGEEEPIVNDY